LKPRRFCLWGVMSIQSVGDSSGIYSGRMGRGFHAQAGTRIVARSIRIL
jgi:hypothetical protein